MKRPLILALLLLGAACETKEPPPPPAAPSNVVAGAEMVAYDAPDGAYRCLAPGDWKVGEDAELGPNAVTFTDPAPLARRRIVSISITRYPNAVDKHANAEAYVRSFAEVDLAPAVPDTEMINGKTAHLLHRETVFKPYRGIGASYRQRHDIAVIPVQGGFFMIEHVAPADEYRRTLPVFKAVARSFRAKN